MSNLEAKFVKRNKIDPAYNTKSIEHTTDNSVITALQPAEKNPDPFCSEFCIEFDATNLNYGDTEAKHQQWMFELRQAFLRQPSGRDLAWIPQALEAYLRRHQGPEGYVSKIKAIIISPEKEAIALKTVDVSVPITFRELRGYALELKLANLDQEQKDVPELKYSPAMTQAVAALSESARYRWEMLARAGQIIGQR